MSSKINRLRAERGKNDEKIAVLRARNNEIDKQITELENLDIVGMVRSMGRRRNSWPLSSRRPKPMRLP